MSGAGQGKVKQNKIREDAFLHTDCDKGLRCDVGGGSGGERSFIGKGSGPQEVGHGVKGRVQSEVEGGAKIGWYPPS